MGWDELADGEVVIEESEELLWRNCAESWLDEGSPTKQLFFPTKKDSLKLSSARESLVSASAHQAEYTALGNRSVGIWAVSSQEVQEVGLRSVDDSATGTSPLTGHCFLDFRQCATGGVIQRTARGLKDLAEKRGRQHP